QNPAYRSVIGVVDVIPCRSRCTHSGLQLAQIADSPKIARSDSGYSRLHELQNRFGPTSSVGDDAGIGGGVPGPASRQDFHSVIPECHTSVSARTAPSLTNCIRRSSETGPIRWSFSA